MIIVKCEYTMINSFFRTKIRVSLHHLNLTDLSIKHSYSFTYKSEEGSEGWRIKGLEIKNFYWDHWWDMWHLKKQVFLVKGISVILFLMEGCKFESNVNTWNKNSRLHVFYKIVILESIAKFAGKYLQRIPFFN